MAELDEEKSQKLTKAEKIVSKKIERAAERIEKSVEERTYLKVSVFTLGVLDFLIFIAVSILTSSIFAIVLVYGYISFITLVAFIPFMVREYESIGRGPPRLVRWFNSLLEKLLPIDRNVMKIGPSILISYLFLATMGGFIAIGIILFADFLSGNVAIYDYLIQGAPTGEYGFFSFVNNSSVNSLVPSILWYLIIFIPIIFCFLFLIAAIHYRNTQPANSLRIVILSPLIVLIPLFLTASSITSPSIIISAIFLGAWGITLLIWYRDFSKRNALILFAVFFTQVLASFLILYAFMFYESRYIPAPNIDISTYYNPLFLILWFGILVSIPALIKGFDSIGRGKLKSLGPLLAVSIAAALQYFFFPLFSVSVYDAYLSDINAAEIYVGFGFFYFYFLLLLIPLFFIFGYFQIGFVRSIYRSVRDYGLKTRHSNIFTFLAGILATIAIFGLVFVYYFFLYTGEDYNNMIFHLASLYNGQLIYLLTNTSAVPPLDWTEIFQIGSLAITLGLLFYSSYRGAYNLSLFADQIEDPTQNIRRLGLFNFIIFTSPRSYKTRVVFGISLIFVFLGIGTIFAFLKIHSSLFADLFTVVPNPSVIIFNTIEGIKLGISFIGMVIAIAIFFYFIYKKRKLVSRI
ncbi:MAG: hypothetical protein EU536_00850 [Promethearchaeota archaeon]|nr:MAG: hypothetical protein EU536_00850 [Candidatus Lokiarchaeota archaeon]